MRIKEKKVMEKNQVSDDKKLEQVNGGVFPSVTEDGSFRIECPFCHEVITGKTREECERNYEFHRKICDFVII